VYLTKEEPEVKSLLIILLVTSALCTQWEVSCHSVAHLVELIHNIGCRTSTSLLLACLFAASVDRLLNAPGCAEALPGSLLKFRSWVRGWSAASCIPDDILHAIVAATMHASIRLGHPEEVVARAGIAAEEEGLVDTAGEEDLEVMV